MYCADSDGFKISTGVGEGDVLKYFTGTAALYSLYGPWGQ